VCLQWAQTITCLRKKKSNLCEEHEAQGSGCVTYTVNGHEKSASHPSHFTAMEVAGTHWPESGLFPKFVWMFWIRQKCLVSAGTQTTIPWLSSLQPIHYTWLCLLGSHMPSLSLWNSVYNSEVPHTHTHTHAVAVY